MILNNGISRIAFMMADVGGMGGAPNPGEVQQDAGFSLADLAELNSDGITAITSRTVAAGIYRIRCLEMEGKQGEANDKGPGLVRFNYKHEIIAANLVDKKAIDPETLVGKKITQNYTVWPADIQQSIGELKGNYQKVGLPNGGMKMGGNPQAEPGWLDTAVGHEFDIRVRVYTDRNSGELRNAFDWLKPEEAAKGTKAAA